jgi:WD40 repeat protein
MVSKAAVLRLVPVVRDKLSRANVVRLEQVLKIVDEDGRAVLADVIGALYPRQNRDNALTLFRQFRREVASAAEAAGVRLSLETDGQTRTAPADRVVWFEGEDRVTEEVKRLVEAEVAGVDRFPQYVKEDRPLRFFVSYAHDDGKLKAALIPKLLTFLRTHPLAQFEFWADGDILPGKKWREEIQRALEKCDFGLLLVSPSFLASNFITKEELPYLLRNKRVIPVALERVLFDGTMDLKGLEERQVFFDAGRKAFSERTSGNPRDAFVRELFQKICALLTEQPEPQRYEQHLRMAVGDFDEERFVHTEGVITSMSKGMESAPLIDPSQRKDAIEFLMEWIGDEKAPPYCALLGEYGMGKTTTCKFLARELLNQRDKGEKVRLPIYLDLRYVGESARRELVLDEILAQILKRGWKSGPGKAQLTPEELIGLVQNEGALVIWDGLDEVLVHLGDNAGQMFTRQLFRILPPAKKGEERRGRMLISCRTHYFRTLRDQQTHFRAEDRDNVRPEDYRAPFVLLPFTPGQIREYIEHTLPDEDPDRVMEVLRSVHNLEEMAERPYTLSLIAERFSRIEQWKAEGRLVTGLMVYRDMVLSWLERDQGKHQLTPDHKQALMEHFAAALWRAGARSWSVGDLEQWLVDFLEARPNLAAHYHGKAREQLKEDLRTATFLVREGDDQFRFAHTSLQEYFLAGYLRRALVEGRPEAWDLPRVSRESLDFLGQWLFEEGRLREGALATLGQLRDVYRAGASELAFAYFLAAHRKGYPAPAPAGFQLPGADLTEWEIAGSAEAPLVLAGMNLRGARLWNSRWRHCKLEGAIFDDAEGLRAEWLNCSLSASSWRGAALEGAVFRDCEMSGANFEEARCDRTQWLRCGIEGAVGLPHERPEALYALCGNAHESATKARVAVATWHEGPVQGCAWSPDGDRIVTGSRDNTVRIWEARTGRCVATLAGHQKAVSGCAWSPDGQRIVSASWDKTLRIWEARTGRCVTTLAGHAGSVIGCGWSPDGQRVASASYDRTLRIWEANSGQCLATLLGHTRGVNGCAWSPDGERIVSVSDDCTISVWQTRSGRCLATFSGHSRFVHGCAWSPEGQRIVSASWDKTVRIWEVRTGRCVAMLAGHREAVSGCAWSPDGDRIVSASNDKTLRIWEAKTDRCVAMLAGHREAVSGCAWSPEGQRIASVSEDKSLRIWEAKTGQCVATLAGQQNWVISCVWSPNGQRIVSASDDYTLRIWEAKSSRCVATLAGHGSAVLGCAWSPDGERVVSASWDKTLRIWEAKTGRCVATLAGHEGPVRGCAWSPDGERVVSASWDRTLRIWEAKTGGCVAMLVGHRHSVAGCAWSPDGHRIVSASGDKRLRIWEAKSRRCLARLRGHEDLITGCAWSPDGQRIVSASDDKTLRIWEAQTGQCVATLVGHEGPVGGCGWSPDGERIVSASEDKTLRIWEAETGRCVATLAGHESAALGCAWSPNGERIVSASHDGTVRTWDAATGVELAPTMYHLKTPDDQPTWCAVDHQNNKILACDAEAWRSLGWIVPDERLGMPEWLPAETFGPLPVS